MDFSFMNNKTFLYIGLAVLVIIAIYYLYKYFNKPVQEYPSQKIINDYVKNNESENFENEKPVHEIDIHSGNPYFIIGINGEPIGKMKFELFDEDVPKTCANFRYLCAKGMDGNNESCYKNSIFHRVIKIGRASCRERV